MLSLNKNKHFTDKRKQLNTALKSGKRGFFHLIMGRTGVVALLLVIDIALMIAAFRWLNRGFQLFFSGGSTIISIVMLIYLLNSSHNTDVKLTWCVLVALSPLFGVLLYIYIKLDLGHRTEQYLLHNTLKETASFRVYDQETLHALSESDPLAGNLGSYLSQCGFDTFKGTSVSYFPDGEAKFEALKTELEKAEHFIFMEYFIVAEGEMWNTILDILVRKAAAGVEVRFMYDGTCAFTCLPYSYPKKLQAMGIKCKMFGPFHPIVTTSYNNRDHRKIAVIDGKTAFTGGINLADEYINKLPRFGHWKDTAIMLQGEAVRSFTLMFLQMWNHNESEREYERYILSAEQCHVHSDGFVIPYGDSPLDKELVGEMVYLHMINTARGSVSIMTPYLILDNEMITALIFAARRGVDVRIILPHIPDKKYAFALAKTHYPELLSAGVHIFEYTPGFVHAKVVLCDDICAVVGTINFDYRSLYHHFECAAYLYNVPALADIKRDFMETEAVSQQITLADAATEKLTTKAAGAVLKLIAPLL